MAEQELEGKWQKNTANTKAKISACIQPSIPPVTPSLYFGPQVILPSQRKYQETYPPILPSPAKEWKWAAKHLKGRWWAEREANKRTLTLHSPRLIPLNHKKRTPNTKAFLHDGQKEEDIWGKLLSQPSSYEANEGGIYNPHNQLISWHTHTHTLPFARLKNVSKAFFPKDYQVSVIT